MKKKPILLFSLIVFAFICLITCENPIMEKWWEEKVKKEEPEYIPLTKNVLEVIYQTIYDTIIEKEIEYQTIVVQLPPEVVYETVYVDKPIYEYIYVQLPPEVIYQTVKEIVIQYIDVPTPPTETDIIKWLKEPANEDKVKEIIKQIPPEKIIEYLNEDQIKTIVESQPPQMIFQCINPIDIEFIIFAGDSSTVNGPPGSGANTSLTPQETAYNTSTIKEMAKLLRDNPTYIILLHGHANPVLGTIDEKIQLASLSMNRANDVKRVLQDEYNSLPTNPLNPDFNKRISCSGYGGEKTLFASNTSYSALNRRVEMILFEIVTKTNNGN